MSSVDLKTLGTERAIIIFVFDFTDRNNELFFIITDD